MYRVVGKTLNNLGDVDKKFSTLGQAEKFIKEMAIKHGIEAKIIEIGECCKYVYPYNSERQRVLQILDANGVHYKIDKSLNIIIEF